MLIYLELTLKWSQTKWVKSVVLKKVLAEEMQVLKCSDRGGGLENALIPSLNSCVGT